MNATGGWVDFGTVPPPWDQRFGFDRDLYQTASVLTLVSGRCLGRWILFLSYLPTRPRSFRSFPYLVLGETDTTGFNSFPARGAITKHARKRSKSHNAPSAHCIGSRPFFILRHSKTLWTMPWFAVFARGNFERPRPSLRDLTRNINPESISERRGGLTKKGSYLGQNKVQRTKWGRL